MKNQVMVTIKGTGLDLDMVDIDQQIYDAVTNALSYLGVGIETQIYLNGIPQA